MQIWKAYNSGERSKILRLPSILSNVERVVVSQGDARDPQTVANLLQNGPFVGKFIITVEHGASYYHVIFYIPNQNAGAFKEWCTALDSCSMTLQDLDNTTD